MTCFGVCISERLRKLERTVEALRQGRLSAEQTGVVSDAATVNPAPEVDLLGVAETWSVKNLKDGGGLLSLGAGFVVALERLIDQKFTAARAAGIKEPRDTDAFDALTELSQQHHTSTGAGEAVGANKGVDVASLGRGVTAALHIALL